MKNLYRQMIAETIRLHLIGFVTIVFAMLIDIRLKTHFGETVFGFYFLGSLFLAFMKQYSLKNFSWLKTLPISRKMLLAFVVSEMFANVVVCGLVTVLSIFLLSSIEMGAFVPKFGQIAHELFRDLGSIERQNLWFTLMLILVTSPVSMLVIAPNHGGRQIQMRADLKNWLIWSIVAVLWFVGLYYAMVVFLGIALGLIMALFALKGLSDFYPYRRFRPVWKAYAIIVFLGAASLPIIHVELSNDSLLKPALRMNDYGIFAKRMNPSDFKTLLANKNLPPGIRLEIAELENYRRGRKASLEAAEFKEWADKAKTSEIFFEGLTLFDNETWSQEALFALDAEIQRRCSNHLEVSQWSPVFICSLEFTSQVTDRRRISVHFKVKQERGLLANLIPDHKLIASMLVQSSLDRGNRYDWEERLQEVASGNAPVISTQAKMWLDRLASNPSGTWNCKHRSRAPASVCRGIEPIPVGLRIEGLTPGDPSGSISLLVE
jgi:hypothetical protein